MICPKCAGDMNGGGCPTTRKCKRCGATAQVNTLWGRQREEAQRRIETAFRSAHRQVFLNCGEYEDAIL